MMKKLFYKELDTFHPLPEWANFFVNLGEQLTYIDNINYRVVVALAVPTRTFAAALVMVGSILSTVKRSSDIDEAKVRQIQNLPTGTMVQYRDGSRKKRGEFIGFAEWNDRLVGIKTSGGLETTYWRDLYEVAKSITVSETDVQLPKHDPKGRNLDSPGEFLACVLGKESAQDHIQHSSLDVLAVGNETRIRTEMCEVPFYCSPMAETQPNLHDNQGYLQDIARVQQFSGTNKAYKSKVYSLSCLKKKDIEDDLKPKLVIIDGALASFYRKELWKDVPQIIILDRTESQFSNAVDHINQDYRYKTDSDFSDFQINIPIPLEMMIFGEGNL